MLWFTSKRMAPRQSKTRVRLGLELLDDRLVPANFVVTTTQDVVDPNDGVLSLREAIIAANESTDPLNTITFDLPDPSTITLTSALPQITGNTGIIGPGSGSLTIQRDATQGQFRLFEIGGSANVLISGLTLANGNVPDSGGAIYSGGTLTINGCILSGNHADGSGGAIAAVGGPLTMDDCTVTGNSANEGGGIVILGPSTARITGGSVAGNSATLEGGGVAIGGTSGGAPDVTLDGVDVKSNRAKYYGGGIYQEAGTLTLTGGTYFHLNAAKQVLDSTISWGTGGGVYVTGGTINLTGVTFAYDQAGDGRGLYLTLDVTENVGPDPDSVVFDGGDDEVWGP